MSQRALFLPVILALLLPACRTGRIDIWSCEDPCYECEDPCGVCARGECVALPSLGWEGPVLLWTGPPEQAEACPDRAPNLVYEGYEGIQGSPGCPACSCGLSACVLSGLVANSADGVCPAAGATSPYPAPDGWDGSCTSSGIIDAADLGSIQFEALTELPCEVQAGPTPPASSLEWGTLARACQASDPPVACDDTSICVPTSEPPPPGFSQCLFNDGDEDLCPPGYPQRMQFYRDMDMSAVGCTECACSPPEGGVCQATVRAHGDTACSVEIGAQIVGLDGPQCLDSMSGFDLQGMSATWINDQPGTCTPSGGEPFGEVTPKKPATFCCQVRPAD